MSTLQERLLQARAKLAAEMIGEGGLEPEKFNEAWSRTLEALELARLHVTPEVLDKRLSNMTPTEKTEWRLKHGDAAFIAKIREEAR